MLKERDWNLYADVKSRLLKNAPDLDITGGITAYQYIHGAEVDKSSGIALLRVNLEKFFLTRNLKNEVLTFQYDTYSKGIHHYHYMQVNDTRRNRSILVYRKKILLNSEVQVFAKLTHSFLQGLNNYSMNQSFSNSLARRYGIPARLLPSGFGLSVEEWEKRYNVPSLGTNDILGSYMYHVYHETLKLDG